MRKAHRRAPQLITKLIGRKCDITFLSQTMRIEANGGRYGMKSKNLKFETQGEIHEAENKVVQYMRKEHTGAPM